MSLQYFTFRYRIYPSSEQKQQLEKIAGACQRIETAALMDMIAQHQHTGELLTPRVQDYQGDYHMDLKGIDPMALSRVLIDLSQRFERALAAGAYPPYPHKKSALTYATSAKGGRVMVEDGKIHLPGVGAVPIVLHRPLPPQKIINATISLNQSGSVYVSLLFARKRVYAQQIEATEDNTLGLDFSVPKFYVDSNGDSPDHPRFDEKEAAKIEALRRDLRRRVKGSKNYQKKQRQLARLYEKVRNRRRDWLHKESRRLADKYDYIAVEDLDLQGIAGTYSLGPHTMDNGYRTFLDMLAYKMAAQGKGLVKINRWIRSSQKCHKCGYINRELTLNTRFWKCPSCGNHNSRDHNAAINIKNQVLNYRV